MAFVGARRAILGSGYTPQSRAIFAAMAAAPSTRDRQLIDRCLKTLLNGGVFPLLDGLFPMCWSTAQASRINWIHPTRNLTEVNSPTFTPYRGYTGDGTSAYLNTGDTNTGLTNFSRDSACTFVWQLNNAQSGGSDLSDTNAQNSVFPRNTSNKYYVRINDGSASTAAINVANTNATGLTAVNRDSGSSRQLYKNGTFVSSDTQASTVPGGGTFQILGISGAFTTNQIAIAGYGGKLTAAQHATLFSAFNTLLKGVGAI